MIAFFVSGATCPAGWTLANGTVVSSTGPSANLYTFLGTTYSTTPGTLPNMINNGKFIRSTGGNAVGLGTPQVDTVGPHTHGGIPGGLNGTSYIKGSSYYSVTNTTGATVSNGNAETRPVNYAMTPCVKY